MRLWQSDVVLPSTRPGAPTIRLDFCDFWGDFDKRTNYLTDLLRREYSVCITRKPDYLIYSNFGEAHGRYDCTKIFYTGENVRPNFRECDFAFTFDHLPDDPRHYRLPLYAWWEDAEKLVKRDGRDHAAVLAGKTRFCNFIYGNAAASRRLAFLDKLSRYKPVDCAGTLRNNTGRVVTVHEKVDFIRQHKFTIAFENAEHPGYTTEKLVQPMLADSVAIYWGNPLIHLDFNTRSFVNVYDHASDETVIERIVALDTDDALYRSCLAEPFYNGNVVNEYVDPTNVLRQFARIFATRS